MPNQTQSQFYQSFNGRESFKNINAMNNYNNRNAQDLFGLSKGSGLVIKSLSKQ